MLPRLIGACAVAAWNLGAVPASVAAPCDAPEAPQQGQGVLPANDDDRYALLRSVAFDATVYGLPAYLQYKELHRQAIDRSSKAYSGFNVFVHERALAAPGYAAFKVPNSDTLYSTAWLDLTDGPLEVVIPPTELKYFTLNLFDIYGNPSNLGTRTIGSGGGRFLLVPPCWNGQAPAGVTPVKVATPHIWVLMRVFSQTRSELEQARSFQDTVLILRRSDLATGDGAVTGYPDPGSDMADFFRVLDFVIRTNGHLPGEDALVSWFGSIGGLGSGLFDPAKLDPVSLRAMRDGHAAAMTAVNNARSQLGRPTGTGWTRVEKGNYRYNYLRRAINNAAGLGANVPEENTSFNTFVDASGAPLDGRSGRYRLHLRQPPPVNAFWSVTLYDAKTFELHPNRLGRYLINDRTPGLKIGSDGSVEIDIQHDRSATGNWLPAPAGPFFLVIRSYLPKPETLSGQWLPPPVERKGTVRRMVSPGADR